MSTMLRHMSLQNATKPFCRRGEKLDTAQRVARIGRANMTAMDVVARAVLIALIGSMVPEITAIGKTPADSGGETEGKTLRSGRMPENITRSSLTKHFDKDMFRPPVEEYATTISPTTENKFYITTTETMTDHNKDSRQRNTTTNTPMILRPSHTSVNRPTKDTRPANTTANRPTKDLRPTNTPANKPTKDPRPTNTTTNTPKRKPIPRPSPVRPANTTANRPTKDLRPTNTPVNKPTKDLRPTNTTTNTPIRKPIPRPFPVRPANTTANRPTKDLRPNKPTKDPRPTNTTTNTPIRKPIPRPFPANRPNMRPLNETTNTPTRRDNPTKDLKNSVPSRNLREDGLENTTNTLLRSGHEKTTSNTLIHKRTHRHLPEAGMLGDLREKAGNFLKGVGNKVGLFMDNLKARYPPVQNMFESVEKMGKRLSRGKRRVLDALMNSGPGEAITGYNLTQMSTEDVVRLLDDLEQIPEPIRNKLISHLSNCTDEEMQNIPSNILPAFAQAQFEELKHMGQVHLNILCDKLLDDGSSPWNLVSAVRGGLRCSPMPDLANKKKCKLTVSQVMMDVLRLEIPPSSWNGTFLTNALAYIGAGVTSNDIKNVPENVIQANIRAIARTELPYPSQRAAMVRRLISGYTTPTAWPDQLVKDLGRLLEDVQFEQLMLVRHNSIEQAAPELTRAGIRKAVTRTTLAKAMSKALRVSPEPKRLARLLPWLKDEVNFLQNLNITNLMEAVEKHDLSLDTFLPAEIHQLARRIEKLSTMGDLLAAKNKSSIPPLLNPNLMPGFSVEFMQTLPDDFVADIVNRTKPMWSVKKARMLIRMFRKLFNGTQPLQLVDIGNLFNGLDLSEVRNFLAMNDSDMDDVLRFLQLPSVPGHLAWYITRQMVNPSNESAHNQQKVFCDDFLAKLGKMVAHIEPRYIKERKVNPFGNKDGLFDVDKVPFTKTQAFAVVDNIREAIGVRDKDGFHVLRPDVIKRLGKLSIGLTAEDIDKLPIDTDLLTVIEALSKYEDDLDSSQIQAVVGKIRDYFDFPSRNVIEEATDITVAQVGRFLQYFNTIMEYTGDSVEFELPKFPQRVRPAMMREIGRSSLSKISTSHRQSLLKFSLKNTLLNGEVVDMTRGSIEDSALTDLGRLKCGLTSDVIEKMTAAAISVHLQDIHDCPFKDDIAKAVVKKALSFNINRLKQREHLASMAGLLEYLSKGELELIDEKELVPLTELVIKATNSREDAWKSSENNGYIRERTVTDKQLHKGRKKQLMRKLHAANTKFYGSTDGCQTVLKFGPEAVDLDLDMANIDDDCRDVLATLPNWSPGEARTALNKIAQIKMGRTLSEDMTNSLSDNFIRETAGLLKGLSANELASLNLTEGAAYIVGSAEGYSREQLRKGFQTLYPSHTELIGPEDLVNMQNFVCGISPDEIRSIQDKNAVRAAIYSLRQLRGCSEEQLVAFAEKYSDVMDAAIQNWDLADLHSMGHLLGGLSQLQLERLSRRKLQAIEPAVLTSMPARRIANFTVEQLRDFTPHQKIAVTSMQKSYLTEPQVAALTGGDNLQDMFTSAGTSINTAPSMITLVLSVLSLLVKMALQSPGG